MVNNGNNQKIVRNVRGAYPHAKEDLLELEAKIADMKAKWEAFQKELEPAPEPIKEEGPSKEELEAEKIAAFEAEKKAKEEAEKMAKIAELQAQLKALNE